MEFRAAPLAPALAVAVDDVETCGEFAVDERLVEIERGAACAPIVEAHLRRSSATEVRALGADIDDAAGIDVAVGEAAGAAVEFDALGVEHVERYIPREAISELTDGGHAAETELIAAACANRRAAGAGVVGDIFGADAELCGVEEIEGGDVA